MNFPLALTLIFIVSVTLAAAYLAGWHMGYSEAERTFAPYKDRLLKHDPQAKR